MLDLKSKDITGVHKINITPTRVIIGVTTKGGGKIDVTLLYEDYPELGSYIDNFSKELLKELEI